MEKPINWSLPRVLRVTEFGNRWTNQLGRGSVTSVFFPGASKPRIKDLHAGFYILSMTLLTYMHVHIHIHIHVYIYIYIYIIYNTIFSYILYIVVLHDITNMAYGYLPCMKMRSDRQYP